ncbi:hypothetical protein BIL_15200 [Bifidobacterium longum subsp. longum F8]|nr:hypothetical protein BIL_15200 [Bifidobacterium longum subsp. longum F8]
MDEEPLEAEIDFRQMRNQPLETEVGLRQTQK